MATPVRRLILINVIIFAVLAATVALAYYGYSFAAVAAARERTIIQDTMRELAEDDSMQQRLLGLSLGAHQ